MQVKIEPSKESAIRKNWELTLSIQPQVCLNKMGASNISLLPYLTMYAPCLMTAKFMAYLQSSLWAEAAKTATLLKNNLITPNRILSPFQQFLGRVREMS